MPKSCLAPEKIQDYLENGLSPQEMRMVAAHLEGCEHCRHEAEAFSNLFSIAEVSARVQLNSGISGKSIDAVFQRLPKDRSAGAAARKASSIFSLSMVDLVKSFFIPAMALLLLFYFFSSTGNSPVSTVVELAEKPFSLVENTTSMLKIELSRHVEGRIEQNVETSLAENDLMIVSVAQHKFKFAHGACFVFGEKEVSLKKGLAQFVMVGKHEGFKVKTPLLSVVPLGTSFELTIKSWGEKVVLNNGRLEVFSCNGDQRKMEPGQTLYVDHEGNFSNQIPQPASPVTHGELPPVRVMPEQPAQSSDSPGKLIDSF